MASNYCNESDRKTGLPTEKVRIDLALKPADRARIRDLAAESDTTEGALISMALSLGLSVLEGPSGREVLEGLSMMRFLRGKP
jgi:hypothetical protein